jgi:hypothetical protein
MDLLNHWNAMNKKHMMIEKWLNNAYIRHAPEHEIRAKKKEKLRLKESMMIWQKQHSI